MASELWYRGKYSLDAYAGILFDGTDINGIKNNLQYTIPSYAMLNMTNVDVGAVVNGKCKITWKYYGQDKSLTVSAGDWIQWDYTSEALVLTPFIPGVGLLESDGSLMPIEGLITSQAAAANTWTLLSFTATNNPEVTFSSSLGVKVPISQGKWMVWLATSGTTKATALNNILSPVTHTGRIAYGSYQARHSSTQTGNGLVCSLTMNMPLHSDGTNYIQCSLYPNVADTVSARLWIQRML